MQNPVITFVFLLMNVSDLCYKTGTLNLACICYIDTVLNTISWEKKSFIFVKRMFLIFNYVLQNLTSFLLRRSM